MKKTRVFFIFKIGNVSLREDAYFFALMVWNDAMWVNNIYHIAEKKLKM